MVSRLILTDKTFLSTKSLVDTLNKANFTTGITFVNCRLDNISLDRDVILTFLDTAMYDCTFWSRSVCECFDSVVARTTLNTKHLSGFNTHFVESRLNIVDTQMYSECEFTRCEGQSAPQLCPTHGAFIAWKKCRPFTPDYNNVRANGRDADKLVKLLIPEDALRSSATSAKCRADKAYVLGVYEMDGKTLAEDQRARSIWRYDFVYETGKRVEPEFDYENNRWEECSYGIHFFVDIDAARKFSF